VIVKPFLCGNRISLSIGLISCLSLYWSRRLGGIGVISGVTARFIHVFGY